jgi:hypothetical protein
VDSRPSAAVNSLAAPGAAAARALDQTPAALTVAAFMVAEDSQAVAEDSQAAAEAMPGVEAAASDCSLRGALGRPQKTPGVHSNAARGPVVASSEPEE